MWNALRSDLTEFVSAVKEDTTTALNQMDEDFDKEDEPSPEEQEALRRTLLRETYTAPLKNDDTDEAETARVDGFLESFTVDSKADDSARLLEEYPDSIKKFFDELVPDEMSKEEFWQRYYYRCDVDQIALEWGSEPEGPGAINAIGNLLGGAVKAVSASLAEDDNGKKIEPGTSTASTLFRGARPPFVMNTAVSEDDEDEEEEDLGWDDEDDDDDEEEDEEEEQIVFNDPTADRLREELKQALEERDLLQQTVHLQSKEIAAIKKSGQVHSNDDVDQLKIKLFEMESELAAVRASNLDTSRMESVTGDETDSELEETRKKLSEAQQRIDGLLAEMESKEELVQKLQSQKVEMEAKIAGLEDSMGSPSDLETKVAELSATVQSLTTEKTNLTHALREKEDDLQASLLRLQGELKEAKVESAKAKAELESNASQADMAKRQVGVLEKELADAKAALKEKEDLVTKLEESARDAAATRPSISPDTVSTGVKVESPVATKLPVAADNDDDDDWGDDWDDDSESAP